VERMGRSINTVKKEGVYGERIEGKFSVENGTVKEVRKCNCERKRILKMMKRKKND
jgi:hypothetical protein